MFTKYYSEGEINTKNMEIDDTLQKTLVKPNIKNGSLICAGKLETYV